ncbi:MAG: glycosyltransferase family 2 protein [Bacteroidaceae bacterium]|nr:glycosyltransferase family 2 protein [Bacteroidaceae bacterium]
MSIIIPVFRTERYLNECVESVLNSCGPDAQLVLVDDGSPDSCGAMCDEWAERDTRIEVIHRPNGGLSAARNSGLDVARGKWVTFVDSDDVVCLPTLDLNEAADIVEYPIRRHFATDHECHRQWGDTIYATALDYWTSTEGWTHTYSCNKIFRRSLFNGIRFPEGRVFEDMLTTPLLLQRALTVRTISSGWYGYRDSPDGITLTASGRELTDLLEGNIEAMRVMRSYDVRHYACALNIQLDVYRLTGRIILPVRHYSLGSILRLPWLLRLKMLIPLHFLCKLHKWLLHRS